MPTRFDGDSQLPSHVLPDGQKLTRSYPAKGQQMNDDDDALNNDDDADDDDDGDDDDDDDVDDDLQLILLG